eukprot:CAMPEP_0204624502 /NCGR_PEP_ID=MMETSP0717-20131115/10253_1 /ASSEMBLY_ACC=CAM_ASM_000666 /TAXON_ID=230516 /ORGANISM="Chaetoceros curvisetus" /LENGTH=351 /DNA_ID=CAMNT_0051639909 /DNA_START=108 /DNA_END=1163 /DNA_ORIENTATION=-
MKLSTYNLALGASSTLALVSRASAFNTFVHTSVNGNLGNSFQERMRQHTLLRIASLSRGSSSIDDELSTINKRDDARIIEIHSILDDGEGHINSDLARSIWQWENKHFQNPNEDDPFPAKRLKYSTRDALRLVEDVVQISNGSGTKERYADLIQEGVVALMKCTVLWDEAYSSLESSKEDTTVAFESFARGHIESAVSKALNETTRDNAGSPTRIEMNLEMLKKNAKEKADEKQDTPSPEPLDKIVQPLSEAVNDENPTPIEIALSDMIRHDIGEFLERQLSNQELKIVRMRFGLEENMEFSTLEMAKVLGLEVPVLLELEREALRKLRISFEDDYIGAYLDDDHTNEVSL